MSYLPGASVAEQLRLGNLEKNPEVCFLPFWSFAKSEGPASNEWPSFSIIPPWKEERRESLCTCKLRRGWVAGRRKRRRRRERGGD